MAVANLDTNKINGAYNTVNVANLTAFDGTAGAEYTPEKSDERVMVVIYNSDASNAEDVTIKAPKNPSKIGGAIADVKVSVGAGKIAMVMVESAKFVDEETGKVTLAGSADVKAAVFQM